MDRPIDELQRSLRRKSKKKGKQRKEKEVEHESKIANELSGVPASEPADSFHHHHHRARKWSDGTKPTIRA